MSGSQASTSALRSPFSVPASPFTAEAQGFPETIDCTGGCVRGLVWAALLEGAGLLTLGCAAQILHILHG